MKVQIVETPRGRRFLLLNSDYRVVQEVKNFLKFCDNCGRSPWTLRTYAYNLKLFYDYLELKRVDALAIGANDDLVPADFLSSFLLWLQYPETESGIIHIEPEKEIRSANTVNQILGTVLSFYQYLAQNKQIEELNFFRKAPRRSGYKPFLYELMHHKREVTVSIFRKQLSKKPLKYITRDQYYELMRLCRNRRDKLLLAILFEGGLRLGEALGMHIEDLCSLEDGVARIVQRENNENGARVKRSAEGIIKLPDYVVDLAVSYLVNDLMEYDTDFVFINYQGVNTGKAMSFSAAEKLFDRLSNRAGFEVHPHMLRHGFATEKLQYGWELIDIQVYLRHKNIVSTQIYAQYTDEIKKEKMRDFLINNEESMRLIANDIRK